MKKLLQGLLLGYTCVASSSWAALEKNLCVFDPIGANGPIFSQLQDYKAEALGWGVDFTLTPYTDERVAAEDFKAGRCDAVSVTGVRGRQFNPFTGSLDSVGAMPDYDNMRVALKTLSAPKAAPLMRHGDYEVAGLIPGGAVYAYVNDRSIDTVGELSGKRIAVLENDPAQKEMVLSVGASPVVSSITTMFSRFNNGSADVCYGPAVVYDAMELYKGIGDNGGVVRFPVAQMTLQLLIRYADFPEDFAQLSREYAWQQFDRAVGILQKAEATIPEDLWIPIPGPDQARYSEMFRQARITLREQGVYDGRMLSVLRRVRCQNDPSRAECSAADKE